MIHRRDQAHAHPGHVWWTRRSETFLEHGWIADCSALGLSFITPHASRLRPGDTITVSQHHGPRPNRRAAQLTFCVRYVEPYDANLSLVACAAAPQGPQGPAPRQRPS